MKNFKWGKSLNGNPITSNNLKHLNGVFIKALYLKVLYNGGK